MKKIFYILIFTLFFMIGYTGVNAQSVVSDGVYKIQSALDSNMVMEITNGDAKNKANIQLHEFNDSNAQKWYIKYLDNGYYEVQSMLNQGMVLDVTGAGKVNGTNLQLYTVDGNAAQRWIIREAGNGYFYFISLCNGLYIDLENGGKTNGTNIQMYNGNGTNAQKFKLVEMIEPKKIASLEDGAYTITSAMNNNKALDITNGVSNNKTNVQLYDLNENWAQIWYLKYLDDGYYSLITRLDEHKSLDVNNGKGFDGANVHIYENAGADSQKWIIKDAGNGYFNIVSKLDNMYLDVANGSVANGANIQLYHGNGSIAQKFKFNKISVGMINDGLYTINSALDSNMKVTLNSFVAANWVNINLKSDNGTNSQKWYIKHLGKGYYSITSAVSTNMSMDVANGGRINGTNVHLYKNNETAAQKWYLKDAGDGTFYIQSMHNSLFLDVANGQAQNGANIQMYNGNKTVAQKFTFTETTLNNNQKTFDDGYYTISSALDYNKVIDISNGIKTNGTNIWLYNNNNTVAQIWYIKYLNNGYYSITSAANPRMSLDAANGSIANGTNVWLYSFNNTDCQQWYLKDLGNGEVSIISKKSGLFIDVAGGKTNNGTNIWLYEGNDGDAQKFKLTRYTETKRYRGIDVSHYQFAIDWNLVSKAGVDFAILKAGEGPSSRKDDDYFIQNVNGCNKYNISYGVYWFINATNVAEAELEAQNTIRRLQGLNPSMKTQVFYDVESSKYTDVEKLKFNELHDIVDKYCTTIENAGYKCGIYANHDWLIGSRNLASFESKFPIWMARYFPVPHPSYEKAIEYEATYNYNNYKYWQFASDGRIPGIIGDVDLDYGYNIFD